MTFDWVGTIMTGVIVVLGLISARTEQNIPYRIEMCVTREDGSQVTMEIWSDFAERYLHHYPGSYCGPCGESRAKCPGEK